MVSVKIDFIKHSSFLIETQDLLLLFDYFITEPQQPIDDLLQKRLQESQPALYLCYAQPLRPLLRGDILFIRRA